MLKWLTFRAYNRLDAVLLMWLALAWRDGHYLAAAVFAIMGCVASGALEVLAKHAPTHSAGGE